MSDLQLAQVRRRAHEAWLAAHSKEPSTAGAVHDSENDSDNDDDVVVVGEKRCRPPSNESTDSDLALALALQTEELDWGAAAVASAAAAAMQEADDRALALALQNAEFADTDAVAVVRAVPGPLQRTPAGPLDVLDPVLETADPTPDIHELFCRFDRELFGAALAAVSVAWSPRMTVCAGICYYRAGGLCEIKLSKPLLQFRPRADLVNTLLHEMIHAYRLLFLAALFVTHNNKDHDGHGPEFHKWMDHLNRVAHASITVYHNFHDEVAFNHQHWWRCTGPCRTKPPYFGYVKRAMNRAPGPRDYWWARHAQSCGGTFEKVLSPPAPPARPRSKRQRTHEPDPPQPPATSDERKR